MDVASRTIIRPPQLDVTLSSSSSPSPPPSPFSPDHLNKEGEDYLKQRLLDQQEEIKGLKTELKNLKRCLKGVHIIGRELQKSKEELRQLKNTPLNGISGQDVKEGYPCSENAENEETRVTEESDDKNNVLSSSEGSSDEEEEEGVSEEEEEEEDSEEDEDSNTDEDDGLDGLEDNVESDEEEDEKPTIRVAMVTKRKHKSRSKPKSGTKSSKKMHQIMSDISQLRAENRELQAAREAESANAFHYVTTNEANQLQTKADSHVSEVTKSSSGMEKESLDREKRYKDIEIENNELKATVREIKKVNHKWDQFWNDKKTEHEASKAELTSTLKEAKMEISTLKALLAQKDTEIGVLKEKQERDRMEHSTTINKMQLVLDGGAEEKENILKEKEGLMLTAKQRIEKIESENEELRREVTKKQEKYEQAQKFARNLLKQKREMEDEIERLNGTLTEKVEEQSLLKSMEPKMATSTGMELLVTEANQHRSSPPLSPSRMLVMEQELFGELTEKRDQDRLQRKPVDEPPAPPPSEEERSLTKAELKEKVELYREQTEAYESDFRRERHDRETVVGQLDSVKKKLRETKAMLHNGHKQPVYVYRVQDKPLHKDPLRHELPGYQATAAKRHVYPNKRDHLIPHGQHGTSKPKEKARSQPSKREQRHFQHRYFEEYPEYEHEPFGEENVEMCRCPKHDCYVPVINPMNNLSKPNGTC